ncbi:efflux RND transporter periplasmic adaptor subunit [Sphingomonas sp. PR090111-T3T-6A]|uniref:efflux RND transporter periplasmic adaptor subunit n=1 Tax=Sphingomonas sp. PR090111-T3T-6A TaxID=685778 RepID=UPI00036A3FFD|nr:efflux RND transporter periplasmic adaptor subunit [Sphingomonas sp. PR090111-T3T-6A]
MNMLTRVDQDERIDAPASEGRWQRRALVAVPLALIAFAGFKVMHHGAAAPAAMPPADVTVATPLARDVTEWDDYVGRFVASQSVEVRPRVSGQVVQRQFKDGDVVKQGQILFTIDQRPFLAAQAEARASVASAQSALTLARSDLARANRLSGDDAVSAGEIDSLRSKVQSAEAALAGAQARLRERSLDVEWTEVRAPVSGRISDRRVDTGNLVVGGEGTSATLLTTINALDPIYFSFDASEALFLKTQRAKREGKPATAVQIRLQDEAAYKWTGTLDFTDNGLDPRSGTIRGRATLANPGSFLTPGMFGNMRLATGGTTHALLVPDASIQTDQARKTVLVVDKDDSVVAKPVTLGAVIDGLRIIRSGLTPGDRVVIAGMQGAIPGTKVAPHNGTIAPDATDDAPHAETPVPAQATFAR